MKKYYVTVNGTRYEVEVEEVKGGFSSNFVAAPTIESIQQSIPQSVKEQSVAAPPEVKEEIKPQPQPINGNVQGEAVECPMPGTILKVNVNVGDVVKKGDVLFVLEAMKMENEIMSSRDGKIVQVSVAKGSAVNTGDTLAVIQ